MYRLPAPLPNRKSNPYGILTYKNEPLPPALDYLLSAGLVILVVGATLAILDK